MCLCATCSHFFASWRPKQNICWKHKNTFIYIWETFTFYSVKFFEVTGVSQFKKFWSTLTLFRVNQLFAWLLIVGKIRHRALNTMHISYLHPKLVCFPDSWFSYDNSIQNIYVLHVKWHQRIYQPGASRPVRGCRRTATTWLWGCPPVVVTVHVVVAQDAATLKACSIFYSCIAFYAMHKSGHGHVVAYWASSLKYESLFSLTAWGWINNLPGAAATLSVSDALPGGSSTAVE